MRKGLPGTRPLLRHAVPIVAIVKERATRRALERAALLSRQEILFTDSLRALDDIIRGGPVKAVLLEIDALAPALSAEHYDALGMKHPGVPVLACSCLTPQSCGAALTASARGLTGFLFADFDDVVGAVDAARADNAEVWVLRTVEAEVGDRLPAPLHDILASCVRDARTGLNLKKLAASLNMSERSIVRRLRRYGISARALIAWGRILVAARLMRHEGRTLEQAALQLGLSSGPALFKMFWERAKLRSSDLIGVEGWRLLVDAMMTTIEHSAIQARGRGRRPRAGAKLRKKSAKDNSD